MTPAQSVINALRDDFYGDWPEAIDSETQVTLQAGSERLVCVPAVVSPDRSTTWTIAVPRRRLLRPGRRPHTKPVQI